MASFSLDLTVKDGIITTTCDYMEIYQGEPLTGRLYHKLEDGTYASQATIQDYTLEALLKDSRNTVKKSWESGSATSPFTYGTDTTKSAGYAQFKIKGSDTQDLAPGIYTFEIAKVEDATDEDRAIGILVDILTIKQANIKAGV